MTTERVQRDIEFAEKENLSYKDYKWVAVNMQSVVGVSDDLKKLRDRVPENSVILSTKAF